MSNDIKQIPIDFFQRNQILVLSESPLTLGICSTSNMEALEDIRLITKSSFEIVRLEREQLESGLRELLLKDARETSSLSNGDDNFTADETLELSSAGIDAPIIKLVNTIFIQAIQNRGTDIHIEPYEKEAWVRIRTDGDLHETMRIPKQSYNGVCARIKVMARRSLFCCVLFIFFDIQNYSCSNNCKWYDYKEANKGYETKCIELSNIGNFIKACVSVCPAL